MARWRKSPSETGFCRCPASRREHGARRCVSHLPGARARYGRRRQPARPDGGPAWPRWGIACGYRCGGVKARISVGTRARAAVDADAAFPTGWRGWRPSRPPTGMRWPSVRSGRISCCPRLSCTPCNIRTCLPTISGWRRVSPRSGRHSAANGLRRFAVLCRKVS